jgi:hypothetical protein
MGRSGGRGKEKYFLLPMKEMRVKTQNGGPHLLVLNFPSWGKTHVHVWQPLIIKVMNLDG